MNTKDYILVGAFLLLPPIAMERRIVSAASSKLRSVPKRKLSWSRWKILRA